MKKLIISFIICLGAVGTGWAQSSEITFIPGLGENGNIWNTMSNNLQNDNYVFTKNTVDYAGSDAISASAANVYIPGGDVVVAHSEGGLVAREYLRQNGADTFKALVTVGTPNKGAEIANSVLNGTVSFVLGDFIKKLLIGPLVYARVFNQSVYQNIINETINYLKVGEGALQGVLLALYANKPGVNDMKPNSSFLNTLNQNPDNTLPFARYAVYGAEKVHTPWHLLGSLFAGQGNGESSGGIKIHDKLESIYGTATDFASYATFVYRFRKNRAKYNYNFDDYVKYNRLFHKWQAVRNAFNVGYHSLVIGDQLEWSAYVTGSASAYAYFGRLFVDYSFYSDDGIVGAHTQAPDFFGSQGTRRLQARDANHLEETVQKNVKARLEQVFQNSDVNISQDNGDGGGDIGPPPTQGCYRNGHWTFDCDN